MKNNQACIILTTTDNKDTANKIARGLIEARLAACIQVDEVESFFYYEHKMQQEFEFRLMIKAPSGNYPVIEDYIKSNHNYDLPQIIKLDITAGLPQYMDWVNR